MGMRLPHWNMLHTAERQNIGFTPQIMVYEDAPLEPVRWEYYVLTIDTRERALPDVERLNELGREGWLLNGVLHEGATGSTSPVHYYFVRQVQKGQQEKQEKGAQK